MENHRDRKIKWEVYIVMIEFVAAAKNKDKIIKNMEKTHYIPVDNKEHKIYLVPKGLYLCGRRLKIELQ